MKKYIPIVFTGIYFLFVFFGIRNHEMWLDEGQHILLASDSDTFAELLYNSRYEGHPLLWNIILYGITRFTDSLNCIQFVHILISGGCVFLILKHAPFSILGKILISFGYFMFYEYSVISRNYGLSLLLILLIVINICSEKRNYIYIFFLLALLFNSHLFASILSIAFVLILWKDFLVQPQKIKAISIVIFGSALVFCLFHLVPPSDHFMHHYNTDGLLSSERFYKALHSAIPGFLPLPDFSYSNYWSNHFLLNYSHKISTLISVFLFLIPAFILRSYKKSFIFFYFSTALVLSFIYFSPLRVATRHAGFYSILLLVSVWLSKDLRQDCFLKGDSFVFKMEKMFLIAYLGIILVIQFLVGILYYSLDVKGDFSCGKKAGAFLNSSIEKGKFIAISHFTSAPALKLYTHHKIYYLEESDFGSFCKWNTNPIFITDSTFLKKINLLLIEKREIVLINNIDYKMDSLLSKNKRLGIIKNLTVLPLKAFNTSTIKSERYFIYSLQLN